MRVIGDGDVFLHLVEFLRQIIRRGVFATVHHAGLQGLINFGEGHDLRNRAEQTEILIGDL